MQGEESQVSQPVDDALKSLESRISALEDIEAIKRLQADYAAACDDGYDADRVAAMFTEDGVWDGGHLGRVEGREAVRNFFAKSSEIFLFAVHFMIAPNIELAGDGRSARGSWYLWEPCTISDGGDGRRHWSATVYDIEYRKSDEGWQFREMNLDIRIFAPVDEGW